jgi:hypothetical protein
MSASRPIFVIGCPRSGTTLLQVMLQSHRRIAVPPETRYLMPAYRDRARFGDLCDPASRLELARTITADRKFRDYGLDRKAAVQRIVAAPPTLGSAVEAVHLAYARLHGKQRWGDKRPGYFQDLPAIIRMFPDAQIVHLVRDGRDCVASLKRMSWFREDSVAAMVLWVRATEAADRAGRRLPADSFHELRYEDLVTDPDAVLRRLCAFLGEDYDPAMAAPARTAEQSVPDRKTWHARTRSAVDAAAVAHGSGLEPWELRLMTYVAQKPLRRYGYPVDDATRPPLRDLARYGRVRTVKRLMTARRTIVDRALELRLRDDVMARPQALLAGMPAVATFVDQLAF